MSINCKKTEIKLKEIRCVCKQCGKEFWFPTKTNTCPDCMIKNYKDRSSADIIFGDMDLQL